MVGVASGPGDGGGARVVRGRHPRRFAARARTGTRASGAGDRATRIERSGTDYLAALVALSRTGDTTRSPERTRGRQAASRILRQAAQEVARLDPNDPLATRILDAGEAAGTELASNEATHIVWY